MRSVYGISLKEVPLHHIHFFSRYTDKPKTVNRYKEVKSGKSFFTKYTNTQDTAHNWRNTHAWNIPLCCITSTIKSLERHTGIKMHRLCKIKYPLLVWMSHHTQVMEYMQSLKCFKITDKEPLPSEENPFIDARNTVSGHEYDSDMTQHAACVLARKLIGLGHRVDFVTTVLLEDKSVLFTAVVFKSLYGLCEFDIQSDENEEFPPVKKPLPSILTLFTDCIPSMMYIPQMLNWDSTD